MTLSQRRREWKSIDIFVYWIKALIKYYDNIFMLKIINKNNFFLVNKLSRRFGSSGGPVNVVLDKNTTWIKYNTVNQHLPRIENYHAWMVSKIPISNTQDFTRMILLNISEISHFSVLITSSIMTPGTTIPIINFMLMNLMDIYYPMIQMIWDMNYLVLQPQLFSP